MSRLKEKLLRLIATQGPISIAYYMQAALTDPEFGYYMGRDPLGRDFVTAPEVSQMFGELIGIFFVQAWENRGRPGRFHLVELGPGRGTLMADILRAAKIRPGFLAAARVHLIEISGALRAAQEQALQGHQMAWGRNLGDVPDDAPIFLVANEFFDALPANQFIRLQKNWHERMVSSDGKRLVFASNPVPVADSMIPAHLRHVPEGTIFETCPTAQMLGHEIGRRVAQKDGAALLIDYGHSDSGLGDTFQAVKTHRYADPLAEPGEADLSFHVDFAALGRAASEAGARIFGPVTQAAFLESLGIRQRAEQLQSGAGQGAADIDAAANRLVSEEQMGTLFKVLALAAPGIISLPGFPC